MLARLVRELPDGDYRYEPKWDGFRCLADRDGGEVELRSRHDRPLGRYFPEVTKRSRGSLCATTRTRRARRATIEAVPSISGEAMTAQQAVLVRATGGAASPARGRARGVRSTTTGVRFDPCLPFEAWMELGQRLGTYSNATSWWLGDWLAFGQMKYGRRYKQAIAATGLDYQTLRNYAVVARRFEPSRRRPDLTFQHHADLCALPDDEQDRWLDRAAAGGWSRNEMRRHLRAAGGRPSADEILRLAVAQAQAERWRRAAERSRCAFEAWAVSVLDDAASAVVGD